MKRRTGPSGQSILVVPTTGHSPYVPNDLRSRCHHTVHAQLAQSAHWKRLMQTTPPASLGPSHSRPLSTLELTRGGVPQTSERVEAIVSSVQYRVHIFWPPLSVTALSTAKGPPPIDPRPRRDLALGKPLRIALCGWKAKDAETRQNRGSHQINRRPGRIAFCPASHDRHRRLHLGLARNWRHCRLPRSTSHTDL